MKAQNEIIAAIRAYFAKMEGVAAVYLFGSYASGRERDGSDIDIGIVSDTTNRDRRRCVQSNALNDLGRKLRKDVHVVILNDATGELLRQVFGKGKCVLVNQPRKHSLFRMVRYAELADFGDLRARLQRRFVRSVKKLAPRHFQAKASQLRS